MVRGEGGGVARFGGHHSRGDRHAPADRLLRPAEVPPSGVGFCAACHPRHMKGVPYRGGRAVRRVPPGPL